LQVLLTVRSRANEYEADRYSVDTYRRPEALVSALKQLSKDNLANLTPHPLHVFLTYSHPTVLARVDAIRAHAAAVAEGSKDETTSGVGVRLLRATRGWAPL
jgi:STE24 endopeptidase